jgi:hypothetical protein
MPGDPWEIVRWTHTRLRRRLLEGLWYDDQSDRLRSRFGLVRAGAMGRPSLAKNGLRRVADELASLYTETPKARHATAGEVTGLLGPEGLITRAGLWPLMRRVQMFTLGLREEFVRLDWEPRRGLRYRIVHPDTVTVLARASDPGRPVEVHELRWRCIEGIGERWVWDVVSIADEDAPFWRVYEARGDGKEGEDWTQAALGDTYSGDDYPFRWTQGARAGQPWLPYPLYHAEATGQLWDPWGWIELVEATLDLGCLWSFWQHAVMRASWPQRWGLDVNVAGASIEEGDGGARVAVPTDPTSLVNLNAAPGATNPQVGQWGPSANVKELQEAISAFEGALISVAGVDAAHIVRESGDAWSGAALSISRDGKREAQRLYGPQFRPVDIDLLEKSACLANLSREVGEVFPEEGYRIDYAPISLSSEELESRREHNNDLIAQGRRSIVEAYQDEHPGVTRVEGIATLKQIAKDNDEFGPDADPEAGPGAEPAVDEAAKAADTALNGAQVEAAAEIVARVSRRELPRESGVQQLVEFFNLAPERAERIMGSVGRTFFVETPQPPPP